MRKEVCVQLLSVRSILSFMMKRDVRIFEILNNSKIVFNRNIVNIEMCY